MPASSVRPKPSFWRLPPGGWPAVLLLGAWLSWVPSQPAPAQFVYDLSSRLIAITTAFVGTQVLLYGAVEGESSDIVVAIRGPARDTTVRRKSRVGPIWVNTRSLEFRAVPSFYAVAASDRLEEIAGPATLARHELGPGNLRLTPVEATGYSEREIAAFRAALVRNKRRTGLFSIEPGTVAFLGDTLFRTRIVFPANVPPGDYQVQVFQFAGGEVVGAQTSTLEISKMGIEAALYEYSLQRPALYGVASIVLALSAGWCANLLFRKV